MLKENVEGHVCTHQFANSSIDTINEQMQLEDYVQHIVSYIYETFVS